MGQETKRAVEESHLQHLIPKHFWEPCCDGHGNTRAGLTVLCQSFEPFFCGTSKNAGMTIQPHKHSVDECVQDKYDIFP